MILLDTNVVSALMRPEQNPRVVQWIDARPKSLLWLATVSLLEIRSGLLFMPEGRRRTLLTLAFNELLSGFFDGRVLPFDSEATEQAAIVDLAQHSSGRNIGIGDIQIAGIARAWHATLATRNIRHFTDLGISLVDPWSD